MRSALGYTPPGKRGPRERGSVTNMTINSASAGHGDQAASAARGAPFAPPPDTRASRVDTRAIPESRSASFPVGPRPAVRRRRHSLSETAETRNIQHTTFNAQVGRTPHLACCMLRIRRTAPARLSEYDTNKESRVTQEGER